MARIVFITGGARSGKSGYAQKRAEQHDGKLLYVATAEVRDTEMADRVEKHQEARGERWRSLEEPIALADRVPAATEGCSTVLIDCLTLWLSNLLERYGDDDQTIDLAATELILDPRVAVIRQSGADGVATGHFAHASRGAYGPVAGPGRI